ncbi:hypothetical protein ACODT3_00295 [Streptomyces sp. 4.24]|uniref:hypothetical protein n=1 Tax=Streptomyces tritrimontium TaxID=3406573 RepID=UPI003BB6AC0A
MSYDLAVWQGEAPSTYRQAAKEHDRLFEVYLDGEELSPIAPEIAKFLNILTDRWPDKNTGDETPWASTPLSASASGPYVYLTISWGSADATSAYVAEVANNLGLICLDPQMKTLRAH